MRFFRVDTLCLLARERALSRNSHVLRYKLFPWDSVGRGGGYQAADGGSVR
jgi:hypothetical protein